jgi:hypothetical protein
LNPEWPFNISSKDDLVAGFIQNKRGTAPEKQEQYVGGYYISLF